MERYALMLCKENKKMSWTFGLFRDLSVVMYATLRTSQKNVIYFIIKIFGEYSQYIFIKVTSFL